MSRRERSGRRRYTVVDDLTREAAIEAVLGRMKAGDSFTAATRAAAIQLDVAETTVRNWVNRSGRRPRRTPQEVAALEAELALAQELNRRQPAERAEVVDEVRLVVIPALVRERCPWHLRRAIEQGDRTAEAMDPAERLRR